MTGKLDQFHELMLAKGIALNEYAHLERTLGKLLSALGEVPEPVANSIVQQMSHSARADVLLDLSSGNKGFQYFKGLMGYITDLNTDRNRIVHWHASNSLQFHGGGQLVQDVSIKPPPKSNKESISIEDLKGFSEDVSKARIDTEDFVRWICAEFPEGESNAKFLMKHERPKKSRKAR